MLKEKRFVLLLVFAFLATVILVVKLRSTTLSITKHPEAATGKLGDKVTLTVAVRGGKTPLNYQWQYAEAGGSTFYNSKAEGNTSNILKPPIEDMAYDYRCVITDAGGQSVISNTARVQQTGGSALIITQQPEAATGKLGDKVTLTVGVSGGKAPLNYQWQYAEAGSAIFYNSKAEGNTSNILKPPIEDKAYDYRCVITDAGGQSVISDTARVQKR